MRPGHVAAATFLPGNGLRRIDVVDIQNLNLVIQRNRQPLAVGAPGHVAADVGRQSHAGLGAGTVGVGNPKFVLIVALAAKSDSLAIGRPVEADLIFLERLVNQHPRLALHQVEQLDRAPIGEGDLAAVGRPARAATLGQKRAPWPSRFCT